MKIAWFHKPSTPKDPSETVQQRLDRLEAGLRQLTLEWEDTYERVHRALARVNKRYRDQQRREEQEQPEESPQLPLGGTISPGLDPISAAIHARRAHALPPRDNGSR